MAIARGTGKITGKARFARILGLMYSDLFWGLQATQNQLTAAQNEAQTVPSSPGPCTITVANAANYNDDLGVYYTAGGANAGIGTTSGVFQRVSAPSQAGQYSVNFATGVYTFASADATAPVLISYTYNVTGTGYKWRSPISCSAPRRPLR